MENNYDQGSYGQNNYVPEQPAQQVPQQPEYQQVPQQPEYQQVPQYQPEYQQVPQPEYPQYQPEYAGNDGGVMGKVKKFPVKLLALVGGGIVAVLLLVFLVLPLLFNTPKAPVKAAEKLVNSKKLSQVIDRAPNLLNGFCESEVRQIIKIAKKTDAYKDVEKDAEELFAEGIKVVEEILGSNYKIKLAVVDKEEIDKDDCEDYQEMLNDAAEEALDSLEDVDDDAIEDAADQMDMKEGDVKKLLKALKSICKKAKKAKISAGYAATVKITISGSELDEDIELEVPISLWKVGGRWVPFIPMEVDEEFFDQEGIEELQKLIMENMDVIQEFAQESMGDLGGLMGMGGFGYASVAPGYDDYSDMLEDSYYGY